MAAIPLHILLILEIRDFQHVHCITVFVDIQKTYGVAALADNWLQVVKLVKVGPKEGPLSPKLKGVQNCIEFSDNGL
jgi:hypothetical protein